MVFSGVVFLYAFLPITLILYYLVPKKARNLVLLITSLVFYSWGEPIYIILMLYSILFNYAMGILMDRNKKARKEVLVFTILINLFLLGFFKYAGFLVTSVNSLFGTNIPVRELPLPIGISFYTFQALSYNIDLYRKKFPVQRNFIHFATYITMFPQLIAGPIVRYEEIEKELSERKFSLSTFGVGVVRFVFGLAKKVLLSNLIGSLFDTVFATGNTLTTLSAFLGSLAYMLQIYFDFSGYSDMAIGLGAMLGFTFSENFDDPYAAVSVTDFWRKWHISLGTWFREYVYIPLGGNRVSVLKHMRNVLIVWFLTGLWHGANWNFILWGLYYGILLILEKYIFLKLPLPKFLTRLATLVLVFLGWIFFAHESFAEIAMTFRSIFGNAPGGLTDEHSLYLLFSYLPLLLIGIFFCMPFIKRLIGKWLSHKVARIFVYIFVFVLLFVCTAFLVTENYNPFLYFRF